MSAQEINPRTTQPATSAGTAVEEKARQHGEAAKQQTQQAQQKTKSAAEDIKQQAGETVESAKHQASETAQEATRQAREAAKRLQQQGAAAVDRGKSQAAEQVEQMGGTARRVAETFRKDEDQTLADAADAVAARFESAGGYLRDRPAGDMVGDLECAIRRHPEVALGGLFVAGMALSRFLKATNRSSSS